MVKTLTLELLRDPWLIHESSIEFYAQLAHDILAGKKIDVGLFGELELPDMPKNIGLVAMSGPLTKSDICGAQGTRSLSRQMAAYAGDPAIDAIVLLSEGCPGGQVHGTQELANSVLWARKKKPVVGAVADLSCSAGYWPIALCDESYCQNETDTVGCIGVVARMRNPKKVDADNPDIIEVYSDLSPDKNIEGRDIEAFKQQTLNPLAEIFHNNVKAGRRERLKLSKENVLSGKTYIGPKAVEYGMVDGIMPMHKIIGRALMLARTQKNRK